MTEYYPLKENDAIVKLEDVENVLKERDKRIRKLESEVESLKRRIAILEEENNDLNEARLRYKRLYKMVIEENRALLRATLSKKRRRR